MKHTRLVLSLSFLFFNGLPVKAQTFFMDSMVYYSHVGLPSTSSTFQDWFKETVVFDSLGTKGEYYTIQRSESQSSRSYKLRVLNDSVFFSGILMDLKTDSIWHIDTTYVEDILIYNFTMQVGDSLEIASPLSISLKLDSIVNKTYPDGVSRATYYYHSKHYHYGYNQTFIKGLGSNIGLVYFPFDWLAVDYLSLVSVCSEGQLLYLNSLYDSSGLYDLKINDYCDEDSIEQAIPRLNGMSVKEITQKQISVYPNPAQSELFLDIPFMAENIRFEIYNSVGAIVKSGVLDRNSISVSELSQGVYLLQIQTQEQVYQARFVKE